MSKTLFDEPKINAVAPWFGSNRMLAEEVGKHLEGCKWVGVGFAGGMAELKYIKAPTIVVNDLHRDVMNLAACISCKEYRAWLIDAASQMPFHPDVLAHAQNFCKSYTPCGSVRGSDIEFDRALWYFVAVWMNRSAKAGTDDEFKGGLPIRWSASGGDSNTRYRSAIESLEAWGQILARCNFSVLDVFEFLAKCKDQAGHGLYFDPPFPGPGDEYRHKFTEAQHRQLACVLSKYDVTKVVLRYYDVPLIRELYDNEFWVWHHLKGRKQTNDDAPEVLIVSAA